MEFTSKLLACVKYLLAVVLANCSSIAIKASSEVRVSNNPSTFCNVGGGEIPLLNKESVNPVNAVTIPVSTCGVRPDINVSPMVPKLTKLSLSCGSIRFNSAVKFETRLSVNPGAN